MLFRKLGPNSPARCTLESGPYLFQWVSSFNFTNLMTFHLSLFSYLIENEVCYLVLCDKMFSKRIAFNYLEDLAQEFYNNYGRKINTVTRPYQFIEFDIYIQKAKKSLTDRRRNINTINNQLQDVQRIMVQNIDDVLQRGAVLSELDTKTQNLSMLSQKYKKSATQLNRRSMYVKGAIGGIILLVLGLYFWVFWSACRLVSVFIGYFTVSCLFFMLAQLSKDRIIKSKFMKHFYWNTKTFSFKAFRGRGFVIKERIFSYFKYKEQMVCFYFLEKKEIFNTSTRVEWNFRGLRNNEWIMSKIGSLFATLVRFRLSFLLLQVS